MQPTPSLEPLAGVRLVPAAPEWHASIIAGLSESQPEVRNALPWFEWNQPMPPQILEYLQEVQQMGKGGLSHHWVVTENGNFVGLIALDHTPHLVIGHWNLGYWIRTSCQGRGLASHSIDAVLGWIGRSGGSPTAIEMRVDPNNMAGVATAISTSRRWNGHRFERGDVEVEIDGDFILHHCWLVPRLPLEDSV